MRVSINDFFIDEFELKNNISKKELESITPVNWDRKLRRYSSTLLEPRIDWTKDQIHPDFSFKFYNLKYSNLENINEIAVLLEFKNKDANYTNGFLTKSSLFNVPIVYVFPTKILTNCETFISKWFSKFGNTSQNDARKETDIDAIKSFYKFKPYGVYHIFDDPLQLKEFSYYDYYLRKNNVSIFIGSSGIIKRIFFKKHNFFTRRKLFGNVTIGNTYFFQYLSNKYKEYANH